MGDQPNIKQQSSAADTEAVSKDQEEDQPPQCIDTSGVLPDGADHLGKQQEHINAFGQESSNCRGAEVGTEEAEHSLQEDRAAATDTAGCSTKQSIDDESIHGSQKPSGWQRSTSMHEALKSTCSMLSWRGAIVLGALYMKI